MKRVSSQLIYLSSFFVMIFLSDVSIASESWTAFVPPSSIQDKSGNKDNHSNSFKTIWRSGANFKLKNNSHYETTHSNVIVAKEYALTQPQRRSVNPWKVNSWQTDRSGGSRQYKFGPTIRPWGSVPEKFQKQLPFNSAFQQPVMNRDMMQQRGVYSSRINNNVMNQSNLLVPMSSYMPFYSNPAMNNFPFFAPPYGGGPKSYLWR